MKQLSMNELRTIAGCQNTPAGNAVANANQNGAQWTDEQWDAWADYFEKCC